MDNNNKSVNKTILKSIYSLEEAKVLTHWSIAEILYMALEHNIELAVKVPMGYQVSLVSVATNELAQSVTEQRIDIKFLVISHQNCNELRNTGFINESIFQKALIWCPRTHKYNYDDKQITISPDAAQHLLSRAKRRFRLDNPNYFIITYHVPATDPVQKNRRYLNQSRQMQLGNLKQFSLDQVYLTRQELVRLQNILHARDYAHFRQFKPKKLPLATPGQRHMAQINQELKLLQHNQVVASLSSHYEEPLVQSSHEGQIWPTLVLMPQVQYSTLTYPENYVESVPTLLEEQETLIQDADLTIPQPALSSIKMNLGYEETETSTQSNESTDFEHHINTPEALKALVAVAKEVKDFWAKDHELNERQIDRIVLSKFRGELSGLSAPEKETLVQIICPLKYRRKNVLPKDRNNIDYLTPEIKAAIKASNEFYSELGLGQEYKIPKKEKVIDFLKDETEKYMTDEKAALLDWIISPVKRKAGRPPKK